MNKKPVQFALRQAVTPRKEFSI